MNNEFNSNNNLFQTNEEEIDLIKILNIFIRNKYLIVFFTISLFVFSSIYSFSRKKVWKGEFQIVVRESGKQSLGETILDNSSLLAKVSGKVSNLNTEVGILQSSSVLMPVYKFYKKERLKLNPELGDISFNSWKNKLGVSLQKSTSIVDISYKDSNKILINKVLDKTIEIYQEYSGKGKKRNLQLSNDYLVGQIEFYRDKSTESMKLVQEYAIDQDLTLLDYGFKGNKVMANFIPDFSQSTSGLGLPNQNLLGENVNIEISRVQAANKIRNIKIKIKKIESLNDNDDIDEMAYINMTIPELDGSKDFNELTKLDLQILDLKAKYTDNYPGIKMLKEKRKFLITLLKERSIGFLKAQIVSAEAILEGATRPKEVLLKYKELVREANRDDITLVQLENKLRGINLEQSRLEDPWELITSPTIKSTPVGNSKSLNILLGSFIGLVLGFIISVLKEKKTGLIFEEDILESLFKTKIIDKIDLNNLNSKLLIDNFFIKAIFKQNKEKSFKFFYSNYLYKLDPKSLRLFFEDKKNNYSIINQFADIKENDIIILVTTIPNISFKEVKKIKTQIELLGKNFYGILIISD